MKRWDKYRLTLVSLISLLLGIISHYYITKSKLAIAFNEGRKYGTCQCLGVVKNLGIDLDKSIGNYCIEWENLPKKYNLEE